GSTEKTGRPPRHVVALERLEQRRTDLGVVGDRPDRDALLLAAPTQPRAERFGHARPPRKRSPDSNRVSRREDRTRVNRRVRPAEGRGHRTASGEANCWRMPAGPAARRAYQHARRASSRESPQPAIIVAAARA